MRGLSPVWPWLRLLTGVGIVGALVWQWGTGSVVAGLRAIGPVELAAALGIGVTTTVSCAWRWRIVATRLGLRLSLHRAVADYYRSLFLNAVLPAGVLGDVERAVRHGRQHGDVGRGVRAVLLERAAGQVAVLAAGVMVLPALPVPAPVREAVLAAAVLVVLMVLVVLLIRRGRPRRTDSVWNRTVDDLRAGLLARDAWPAVAALSAVALTGYLLLFLVAAAAAGTTAPVAELVPLLVLSLLAMGLPVNVGGWGPREGAAAVLFGAAGLGAEQGLATAVVYGVLALVASLPGACLLAVRWPAVHPLEVPA